MAKNINLNPENESKTNCFRSKLEHVDKKMPQVKGTCLVAVDIGYSTVKYFSAYSRGAFPSYARKIPQLNPKEGIRAIGDQPVYQIYDCLTDSFWVLGDDAFDYVTNLDIYSVEDELYARNRYGKDYRILTAAGIALSTMNGCKLTPKSPIYLHTGLPHRFLDYDSSKLLKSILGEYSFRFSKNGKDWIDFNFTLDENNIKITSQPSGTFRSILVNDDMKPMSYTSQVYSGSTLIIDPGFLTLDYFTYISGEMIGEGSTDPHHGMKAIFDNTIKKTKHYCKENNLIPTELSTINFQKRTLSDGFFYAREKDGIFKKIDIYPFLMESVEELGKDAIEKIERTLPMKLAKYDFVILTGGTGHVWYNIFEKYLSIYAPDTKLLKGNIADHYESSIYANVRGYYISSFLKLSRK